jgi:hypothetical protein
MTMSYSFQEPDWPPVCDCRYDEVRDEMDRGNCAIHCRMEEVPRLAEEYPAAQRAPKKPAAILTRGKENAA